jgi:hypothetical protein
MALRLNLLPINALPISLLLNLLLINALPISLLLNLLLINALPISLLPNLLLINARPINLRLNLLLINARLVNRRLIIFVSFPSFSSAINLGSNTARRRAIVKNFLGEPQRAITGCGSAVQRLVFNERGRTRRRCNFCR